MTRNGLSGTPTMSSIFVMSQQWLADNICDQPQGWQTIACGNNSCIVVQIQDKDIPILSHLVDIRTVNLRDEEDVSTSNNDAEDDEEDDDEDVGPKVTCGHSQMLCLPYYIATWLECTILLATT